MKTHSALSAAAALLIAIPAFAQDADMMEPPESCALPGQLILSDAEGDADAADATIGTGVPHPDSSRDLIELTIAQIINDSGDERIAFRIQNAGFIADIPESAYFVSFASPTGAIKGVRMSVDAQGNVAYSIYTPGASNAGTADGRFVDSEIPADPASYHQGDEIVIFADPARLGILEPGEKLTQFNAGTTTSAEGLVTFVNDGMPDDLSRRASYTYLDTSVDCAADPDAPEAKMAVSHTSGNAPLTVQFDASQSQAKDGSALSYTFNFGDNSPEVTSQLPYATHTYVSQGLYTAALTVTDASGREDYATTDIAAGVVPAQSRSRATVAGGALGWMLLALGAAGVARRRR